VADRGDRLPRRDECPDEVHRVLVHPQFVGVDSAAGQQQRVRVVGRGVGDQPVDGEGAGWHQVELPGWHQVELPSLAPPDNDLSAVLGELEAAIGRPAESWSWMWRCDDDTWRRGAQAALERLAALPDQDVPRGSAMTYPLVVLESSHRS
jgi:hypothetical protein